MTRLAGGLIAARDGTVVLSATNGKTTTAAMVASVLERRGAGLVHNRAGANMAGGVASALAAAASPGGRRLDGTLGLFEVDEFWLPQLLGELRPRAVLLANLFRDQLDRYGELETIGERWLEAIGTLPAATQLVLPADEPLVADAQAFDLERRFGLIIVPMQTLQLLDDRGAFLRCARAALTPGGLLALSLIHI